MNVNDSVFGAIVATLAVIIAYFSLRQVNKGRHEVVRPEIWFHELLACFKNDIRDDELVLCLKFENIGRGDAFKVQFKYLISKNAILKKLSFEYLKYLFGFPFVGKETQKIRIFSKDEYVTINTGLLTETAKSNFACVMIKVIYKDELGKKYRKKEYVNFQDSPF